MLNIYRKSNNIIKPCLYLDWPKIERSQEYYVFSFFRVIYPITNKA